MSEKTGWIILWAIIGTGLLFSSFALMLLIPLLITLLIIGSGL